MKLHEHLTKVFTGNIEPRVVEHPSSKYVAWFPTWEGPARPDYAAALADLNDKQRKQMNIHQLVNLFTAEFKRLEGYTPAPFQKAIAMQRLERGQSIREIIDALVAQRIKF